MPPHPVTVRRNSPALHPTLLAGADVAMPIPRPAASSHNTILRYRRLQYAIATSAAARRNLVRHFPMSSTSASLLERLRTDPKSPAWQRMVEIYQPLIRAWLSRQDVL